MSIQNLPAQELPNTTIYGLQISNDAITPNTVVDISVGQCRDSNDNIDMVSGSVILVNAAVNGYNGLDQGTFAEASIYAVWLIGDSSNYNPIGAVLSLASNAIPLMPFGYDSYRKIGYTATISSSAHFLPFYAYGNGNLRVFNYDAPQATAVTAGAATVATAVDLSAFVPWDNNVLVNIFSAYTPNAAADSLSLQGLNATGFPVVVLGQVAHVVINSYDYINAQLNVSSGKPEINYKVSSASDSVALNVSGFTFTV